MDKSYKEICRLCSKPANFCCNRCLCYYCSLNCQIKDWPKHMYECFPTVSKPISIPLWQQTPSPPVEIYIKVAIKGIDEQRKDYIIAWAMEINNLQKLQEIIKDSSYLSDLECPIPNLKEGCLAAAWLKDCYQRARVLHIFQNNSKAVVQFIDYGTVKLVFSAALCPPTPLMEHIRPLAFNIKLSLREEQVIREENEIWIRIITNGGIEGLCMAEQMPTDGIQSLFFLTSDYTGIRLSKILEHNGKILVRLTKDHDHELTTLPSQNDDESLYRDSPGEGCFVFALYQKIWHRGCLVMWSETMDMQHLVYFFDQGVMRFCKKLRPISTEVHQKIPMRTLMISLENTSLKLAKTLSSIYKENLQLSLRVDLRIKKRPCNKTNQAGLPCILYKEKKQLCTAIVYAFQGNLEALNLKFWQESVENGSRVIIKKCLNHRCVIIAPSFTKIYKELFTSMAMQCPVNSQPMDIDSDDMYLAYHSAENYHYRARFLNNLPKTNAMVEVIDIDSGNVLQVKRSHLRIPNYIVRNCPIYLQNIQLEGLNDFEHIFQDNSALSELKLCVEHNREFIVEYNSQPNEPGIHSGVQSGEHAKLFYPTNPNRTLNDDLIVLLKEDIITKEIQTTTNSTSIQSSSKSSKNLQAPLSNPPQEKKVNFELLSQQFHRIEKNKSPLLGNISNVDTYRNFPKKPEKITEFDFYERESLDFNETLNETTSKKSSQTAEAVYLPEANLKPHNCGNKNFSAKMVKILLDNRQKVDPLSNQNTEI